MEGRVRRTESWSAGLLGSIEKGLSVRRTRSGEGGVEGPGQQSSKPPGSDWKMWGLGAHQKTAHTSGF